MNKVYNTQEKIATDFTKFFKKVSDLTKPQLKLLPYIILGMIQSESVVRSDIVKKLKGNFCFVKPSSTEKRLERFFNNSNFDVYHFFHQIISHIICFYRPQNKNMYITIDHEYCRDDFTILFFSLKIGKQRYSFMV